jgi:DNA repair photolyase
MAGAGLNIRVLTKNPMLALELDSDCLKWANVEFGSTILFADDAKRAIWESGAPSIESRISAMRAARSMGLRTWVSLEPVIDPTEALAVIEALGDSVDVWKVGRWNHDKRANSIDWKSFLASALEILHRAKAAYYIKDELWRSGGGSPKYPKEVTCPANSNTSSSIAKSISASLF